MNAMNMRLVFVNVKSECVAQFLTASFRMGEAAVREQGLVSFALLQETEMPTRFSMFEAYHDDNARAQHLSSESFRAWEIEIDALLVEPLTAVPHIPVFPAAEDWERHLEN
jgi:(4S)-4-hydroxy-5-phosphonooxypentane-2,3-dione isomerase